MLGLPVLNHRRPRTVPARAVLEIDPDPDRFARYLVDGRIVARVTHHDNGHPRLLCHLDEEGRKHGLERYFFEDGSIQWETRHVHGLQHGLQRDWDRDGKLLCATRFVRGTGRDLWWGGGDHLAELREYVDGQLHGIEQWWLSPKILWQETWYFRSQEHGISREWDDRRLAAGFPRFFVYGSRVSRAVYQEHAISDPTLPPYIEAEDRPNRRPRCPPRGLVPSD